MSLDGLTLTELTNEIADSIAITREEAEDLAGKLLVNVINSWR